MILGVMPFKIQHHKDKIHERNSWVSSKLKTSACKNNINRIRRQVTDYKKILAKDTTDKEVSSPKYTKNP